MRVLLLALLSACGGPAQAGDLWMDLDLQGSNETIHMHLPGNWLLQAEEPVTIEIDGGSVDLSKEARALKARRVGAQSAWTLDRDGSETATLALIHQATSGEPAKSLGLQTRGPKGNGLTMTVDLTPEPIGQATQHLDGVVDLNGIKVDLNQALCDQLKASPGTVLVTTTGPKGGGITIDTR